jgi:ADP-ribose pyrophosphatase YjhB (NUDIX family)
MPDAADRPEPSDPLDPLEPAVPADFLRELLRWSEALAGIARTGMAFTQNLYERERYEEVLKVASDIRVTAEEDLEVRRESDHVVQEWLDTVGRGIAGYVTPKVAVGAVVGNDEGQILLVQRADSGAWLYPTGWADVGYSPVEVALKEVEEETGVLCEPVRLLAVLDGLRMGYSLTPMYSILFHLKAVGGALLPHPLECAAVGWFGPDELPYPTIGAARWAPHAFAAIRGEPVEVVFDEPRAPIWKHHPEA